MLYRTIRVPKLIGHNTTVLVHIQTKKEQQTTSNTFHSIPPSILYSSNTYL